METQNKSTQTVSSGDDHHDDFEILHHSSSVAEHKLDIIIDLLQSHATELNVLQLIREAYADGKPT